MRDLLLKSSTSLLVALDTAGTVAGYINYQTALAGTLSRNPAAPGVPCSPWPTPLSRKGVNCHIDEPSADGGHESPPNRSIGRLVGASFPAAAFSGAGE
ncbi:MULTISPECIES: hypothetical protein, partial [unclassified Microbispora]|uniref:hypothetical protein n=1 Tax=unclassified Microbispora TaxID=2614687 RepID=UPI00197B54E3